MYGALDSTLRWQFNQRLELSDLAECGRLESAHNIDTGLVTANDFMTKPGSTVCINHCMCHDM